MTWWLVHSCANGPSNCSTARRKGWILKNIVLCCRCFQFFWCLVVFVVFSWCTFPFCSHSSPPTKSAETSASFDSVFEGWQQTSALFPMTFAALSLVWIFSFKALRLQVGHGMIYSDRVGGSCPKAAKSPLERTWVEWCRVWIYGSCNALIIREESGQTSNSYHSKSGNGGKWMKMERIKFSSDCKWPHCDRSGAIAI